MKLPYEDVTKEILPKVYDDLAHPSASQIGQAIGGLLRFVVLPFKFLGMTAEELEIRFQQFIADAKNRVPEERRIMPKASIIVPLLEHAKYAFEEKELLETFSKLLASCIDIDYSSIVHPSFVQKITQMSSFDIRVLEFISSHIFFYCDVCVKVAVGENASKIFPQIFLFTNMKDFDGDSQQVDKSINLLISLGILEVDSKEYYRAEEYANRLVALRDQGYESAYDSDLFSNYTEMCIDDYCGDYEETLYDFDRYFYGIELSPELENMIHDNCNDEDDIEIDTISSTRRVLKLTSYGKHFKKAIFREDN